MLKPITVTGLNENIAWLQSLAGGVLDNAVAAGMLEWADPVLEECIAETPFDTGALRSTERVDLDGKPGNGHAAIAFEAGGEPGTGPWKTVNLIGKSGQITKPYVDYAEDIHEDIGKYAHPIHDGLMGKYDCEGTSKFIEGPVLRNLDSLGDAITKKVNGVLK